MNGFCSNILDPFLSIREGFSRLDNSVCAQASSSLSDTSNEDNISNRNGEPQENNLYASTIWNCMCMSLRHFLDFGSFMMFMLLIFFSYIGVGNHQ